MEVFFISTVRGSHAWSRRVGHDKANDEAEESVGDFLKIGQLRDSFCDHRGHMAEMKRQQKWHLVGTVVVEIL